MHACINNVAWSLHDLLTCFACLLFAWFRRICILQKIVHYVFVWLCVRLYILCCVWLVNYCLRDFWLILQIIVWMCFCIMWLWSICKTICMSLIDCALYSVWFFHDSNDVVHLCWMMFACLYMIWMIVYDLLYVRAWLLHDFVLDVPLLCMFHMSCMSVMRFFFMNAHDEKCFGTFVAVCFLHYVSLYGLKDVCYIVYDFVWFVVWCVNYISLFLWVFLLDFVHVWSLNEFANIIWYDLNVFVLRVLCDFVFMFLHAVLTDFAWFAWLCVWFEWCCTTSFCMHKCFVIFIMNSKKVAASIVALVCVICCGVWLNLHDCSKDCACCVYNIVSLFVLGCVWFVKMLWCMYLIWFCVWLFEWFCNTFFFCMSWYIGIKSIWMTVHDFSNDCACEFLNGLSCFRCSHDLYIFVLHSLLYDCVCWFVLCFVLLLNNFVFLLFVYVFMFVFARFECFLFTDNVMCWWFCMLCARFAWCLIVVHDCANGFALLKWLLNEFAILCMISKCMYNGFACEFVVRWFCFVYDCDLLCMCVGVWNYLHYVLSDLKQCVCMNFNLFAWLAWVRCIFACVELLIMRICRILTDFALLLDIACVCDLEWRCMTFFWMVCMCCVWQCVIVRIKVWMNLNDCLYLFDWLCANDCAWFGLIC